MEKIKIEYWKKINKDLLDFFYLFFYLPLLISINQQDITLKINNAKSSYPHLIKAIKDGQVKYNNHEFSGKFNIKISHELSNFAVHRKRKNIWIGIPNSTIIAAAIYAEKKQKDITHRMILAINECEKNIQNNIDNLTLGDDLPIQTMERDIKKDLWDIGIIPEISEGTLNKLQKDYTDNMNLYIKDWIPQQIIRLRKIIENYQTTPTNDVLQNMIQKEFNVSANKAHFLSIQETRLFFSKLSMNRASEIGIHKYRWSTSHDERVRISHRHLDGKIIDFDNPPIVDPNTGRRAHAGEDFGCRCSKIWIR